ncbi:MAG: hypothetical protein IT176_09215 [Acidobacteria bacterium]|nr:hypothetical protein [Acidobacteriota bacterium]
MFGVVGALLTAPLGADNRLAMRVSPAVAFEPANLVVRTMVEANAENRAIEIVAESESFYRSSEVQLDGEQAPRVSIFEFRSLPSGSYEVRATLYGSRGQTLRSVHQSVSVMAGGGR